MNIDQAKSIPLAEILDKLNIRPIRMAGHDLYFLAPFRDEKTASFHVNTHKNVWFDFGTGEGGDTVSFIRKHLEHSGVGHSVNDALRWAGNIMGYSPVIKPVSEDGKQEREYKLMVTSKKEIEHAALVHYLNSRGIPLSLAKLYLKQITVQDKQTKKSIFGLGFRNDDGGYEIRNHFFKGTAGTKYITFIRGETIKPSGIHIFETWPDYLSALIRQGNGRRFKDDAIILNSVSNLSKVTPYIKGYGYAVAYSWMDNDKAGKESTNSLEEFVKTEENLSHKPMNKLYAPHKDVNAWHMVKLGLVVG